jgi:hypothetical protein
VHLELLTSKAVYEHRLRSSLYIPGMNNSRVSARLIRVLDEVSIRVVLVVLGLALAELSVRVLGFRPWVFNPADQIRNQYTEVDPELGWRLRPQSEAVVWSGNERHSETILPNNTRLVTRSPQVPHSPTAIIVGDSSIYGWGVGDEDTFASQLAAQIPNWRVVNGAVPGYGALQSFLRTRQLLSQMSARIVIMGYADYFPARDLGLLSWTVPVAERSITNNATLPHADVRDGKLVISQAGPLFMALPGRRYFALVRMAEELISSIPAMARRRRSREISLSIMRTWAQLAMNHAATPVVMLWNNAGQLNQLSEDLTQLGVRVVDCSHPSQGAPETVLDADGHPTAAVVRSWSTCLSSRHAELFRIDDVKS